MNNDLYSVSSHPQKTPGQRSQEDSSSNNRISILRKAKQSQGSAGFGQIVEKIDNQPETVHEREDEGQMSGGINDSHVNTLVNNTNVNNTSHEHGFIQENYQISAGSMDPSPTKMGRIQTSNHVEQTVIQVKSIAGHAKKESDNVNSLNLNKGGAESSALTDRSKLSDQNISLHQMARDAMNQRINAPQMRSLANEGTGSRPGTGSKESRPSVRLRSNEITMHHTKEQEVVTGPNRDTGIISTIEISKKHSIEPWLPEQTFQQQNMRLPSIQPEFDKNFMMPELKINKLNEISNSGHSVRQQIINKSKSQQRLNPIHTDRLISSSVIPQDKSKPYYLFSKGRLPAVRSSVQMDNLRHQGIDGNSNLKTLLAPHLPLAKNVKRNDMILLSARLQQARQSQLSQLEQMAMGGGSAMMSTMSADQRRQAQTIQQTARKDELMDASMTASFKAQIPGQKQAQKLQFLDKIASTRSIKHSSQLRGQQEDSTFGMNRHFHEYQEKQEMTKRVKMGQNNGIDVSIEGRYQPGAGMLSRVQDGNDYVGIFSSKMEQQFEMEVRTQLKNRLKIFSKETQNIIKRGIEYILPLKKTADIDFNSYKKEQLRNEYLKYLTLVITAKQRSEIQAENGIDKSPLSGIQKTKSHSPNKNNANKRRDNKVTIPDLQEEEDEDILSPSIHKYIEQFVISLKEFFEGSHGQTGLLQEEYVMMEEYWFLLEDLANCTEKDGTALALRIENYRKNLPNGTDYFSRNAYMDQVKSRMGVVQYQKLFTRSGFIEKFMREYWSSLDRILTSIKQKIQANHDMRKRFDMSGKSMPEIEREFGQYVILMLSQSFYILRNTLALRLDNLFKYEDNRKNNDMDELRASYEKKLSDQKKEFEAYKAESIQQKSEMLKRIEELKDSLHVVKLERDYMQTDLHNSRNFAQKLKDQLTYFTHDNQLGEIIQTNYDSQNVDELGQRNKESLHREQRKFGEEVVQDLLVRLNSHIKEIDTAKATSANIAARMNYIIDKTLGERTNQGRASDEKSDNVFNQFMPISSEQEESPKEEKYVYNPLPVRQDYSLSIKKNLTNISSANPLSESISSKFAQSLKQQAQDAIKRKGAVGKGRKNSTNVEAQNSKKLFKDAMVNIEQRSSATGILEEESEDDQIHSSEVGGHTDKGKRNVNPDLPSSIKQQSSSAKTSTMLAPEGVKSKKTGIGGGKKGGGKRAAQGEPPGQDSVLESLKTKGTAGTGDSAERKKTRQRVPLKGDKDNITININTNNQNNSNKRKTPTAAGAGAGSGSGAKVRAGASSGTRNKSFRDEGGTDPGQFDSQAKVNVTETDLDNDELRNQSQITRTLVRNPSSVQVSSVKGWKGGDGSPGKQSIASFQGNDTHENEDSSCNDINNGHDIGVDSGIGEGEEMEEDDEVINLEILMQNNQLKQMIEGSKPKEPTFNDKTENLKSVLKSEVSDNKIMMQMTRQKLFSIIDELLGKRLDTIFEISFAYKGVDGGAKALMSKKNKREGQSAINTEPPTEAYVKEIQKLTLVEFIFNHYLRQYELKSMAIKQINSLVLGLIKYFEKNKEENFFLFFLLRLLDFDEAVLAHAGLDPHKSTNFKGWQAPEQLSAKKKTEEEQMQKKLAEMKGEPNIWDRWANQKAAISEVQPANRDYSKFTYEQQAIVLWSRKVFTYAQNQFLRDSQHSFKKQQKKQKHLKTSDQEILQNIEMDYKVFNRMFLERNGGVLGLNYIVKILHRALFGEDMPSIQDHKALKESVHYHAHPDHGTESSAAAQPKAKNPNKNKLACNVKDKDYYETHQAFIEMLINLQVEDLLLYDMHSATSHDKSKGKAQGPNAPVNSAYKAFDEYDQNYKLFSEAKFILWKLLALIKYSHTSLADFPVSKTQASLMSSNLRDMGPRQGNSPQRKQPVQPKPASPKKGARARNQTDDSDDSEDSDEVQMQSKLFDVDYQNKCIDLVFLLEYLEKKYLQKYKKKEVSKDAKDQETGLKVYHKETSDVLVNAMKMKTRIFKTSQMEVLKNFLGHLGLKDIRMVKVTELEQLINQHVEKQNYLFPNYSKNLQANANQKNYTMQFDQTRELHLMSYTQFCKLCLSQWKLTVQDQIQYLHKIFYDSDDNQDGVLTLAEFWGLLIHLESEGSKKGHHAPVQSIASLPSAGQSAEPGALSVSTQGPYDPTLAATKDLLPGRSIHHGASSSTKSINKDRAILLFNEALDFSNADIKEEQVKEAGRQQELRDAIAKTKSAKETKALKKKHQQAEEKQLQVQEAKQKNMGGIDKITAQGFTRMVMKNQVGGFAIGRVFSDLRFTLLY